MKSSAGNRLRIIGGVWRGRRIDFPNAIGLRPTSDRLRETLFNWLQWKLPESRCLDLFAGSGALGFEAASRGAKEVVLVEALPGVADCLKENAARLGTDKITVLNKRAECYLTGPVQAFDIVFLDPPFAQGLLEPTLEKLTHGGWLRPGACVYLEYETTADTLVLPPELTLYRQQRGGQATGALARWRLNDGAVADR